MLKDSFILSTRWLKSFVVKGILYLRRLLCGCGINLISSEPHLLIIRWINKPVWISQGKLILCWTAQRANKLETAVHSMLFCYGPPVFSH